MTNSHGPRLSKLKLNLFIIISLAEQLIKLSLSVVLLALVQSVSIILWIVESFSRYRKLLLFVGLLIFLKIPNALKVVTIFHGLKLKDLDLETWSQQNKRWKGSTTPSGKKNFRG